MTRGQPLHHQRRPDSVVDLVGQPHERIDVRHDPLGVAGRNEHPRDALAHLPALHTGADIDDAPGTFDAKNGRLVATGRHPTTRANIHEVHARRSHLDHHFVASGGADGLVGDVFIISIPPLSINLRAPLFLGERLPSAVAS